MGARKRLAANKLKEIKKNTCIAILNDSPSSPRKMRLVVDLIRGKEVNRALDVLKFTPKDAARDVEKLLLSAISNWQQKNPGSRVDDNSLVVKTAYVDGGRMLKRIQPAPQGRAHRIRKRSNHVTLILDKVKEEVKA